MDEDPKHYLLVNRGRYLCSIHGAFCDSSDNYLNACPLCREELNGIWTPNYVDRALQLINGLQGRSKRNLTIVSGLIGGAGLIRFISGSALFGQTFTVPEWANMFSLLAAIFLIASVAFYAASMRQVDTTTNNNFPVKTIAEWETKLATELSTLECFHRIAGWSLGCGILAILAIFTISFLKIAFC